MTITKYDFIIESMLDELEFLLNEIESSNINEQSIININESLKRGISLWNRILLLFSRRLNKLRSKKLNIRKTIDILKNKQSDPNLTDKEQKMVANKLSKLRSEMLNLNKRRNDIISRRNTARIKRANNRLEDVKNKTTLADYTEKRGAKIFKKFTKKKQSAEDRMKYLK